jgi:hypothetical protein
MAEGGERRLHRRTLMKATGAGAALVWVAPTVDSFLSGAAASSQPIGNAACTNQGQACGSGIFVVPAGSIATITIDLSNGNSQACDQLNAGYEIAGVKTVIATKLAGCQPFPAGSATIDNSGGVSPITFSLYLEDFDDPVGGCDYTFSSFSSHACQIGDEVYFSDALFCDSTPADPRCPGPDGDNNLALIVSIT